MAATGYTPISLYYSTTASAVPTSGNLANGELALNIADMKLYAKNSAGTVTLLASNAATAPAGSNTQIQYNNSGAFGASSALTFNGNKLGVQTSAVDGIAANFQATASNTYGTIQITGNSRGGELDFYNGSTAQAAIVGNSGNLFFYTNGNSTLQATLDSAGNLGLGITPSAWRSGDVALDIGSIASLVSAQSSNTRLYNNTFVASGGTNTYKTTSFASYYDQGSGIHRWFTAPSGTAGNAISFTQAMTLDASGNLGIGQTSPTGRLHVQGLIRTSSSASGIQIDRRDTSASAYTLYSTAGNLQFYNGTGDVMTLSTAGGLSVGTAADPGAGAIYATGNITAYYSDDRLKTRLGVIENALDKVDQLQGFYYEANETAQALGYKVKREVGVSAQSVQAVLPEIVSPAPIDQQYLTVDYERLVPLLIEAVKELRAEVNALKGA